MTSADATHVLAAVYTLTAADYAALWSPVIRPMGVRLVAAMPLAATRVVLDVGTGCGALLPVIRTSAPEACIVGIDPSAGMLSIARAVAPATGLALMGAEQLGLRSAAFDAAVLAFVLFHLPDPVGGLSEIARVLRRGGVIGTTTWGADQLLPRSDIWSEELDASGAGAAALPETVQQHTRMDTPAKVRALLEVAGFQPLRLWAEPFVRHWTGDELFSLRSGHGLFNRRLRTLGEEVRRQCLERIRERMARLAPEELIWRPEIVFAVGQTP
jgi:SAM-dependent methyltransferase